MLKAGFNDWSQLFCYVCFTFKMWALTLSNIEITPKHNPGFLLSNICVKNF